MTLSELVPSLDFCHRLKEKGFPQDTAMAWATPRESFAERIVPYVIVNYDRYKVCLKYVFCAAPTAGELEEWLRARKPNASMTISSCNGDVPTINVDIDDNVVGLHKGVGQYRTLVAALSALALEVAG